MSQVLEEFQSLQDSADAQTWGEIATRVEKHTPGGISEVYESFSEDPINAASIAQVHLGTRKTGDKVAVKTLGVGFCLCKSFADSAAVLGMYWANWPGGEGHHMWSHVVTMLYSQDPSPEHWANL